MYGLMIITKKETIKMSFNSALERDDWFDENYENYDGTTEFLFSTPGGVWMELSDLYAF